MAANNKTPGELMTHTGANDSTSDVRSLQLNSGEAQRQRLLKRLQQGPATTIELRRDLDIMMPAARVHELRHRFGHDIHLHWITQATDCGKLHRVGLYELRAGKFQAETVHGERYSEARVAA
tara:strand:+ start:1653 stop:2018 length:366 start_codon:yes stop_codon:yes gene_type:complete